MRKPEPFQDDQISWIINDLDFTEMLLRLSTAFEVSLDLETTGLDEFAKHGDSRNGGVAARVVMAQFSIRMGYGEPWLYHYVLPLSHPQSPFIGEWRKKLLALVSILQQYSISLIGHNLKFDFRHIHQHTGIDLSPQLVWDTQISSHLLDEIQSTKLKEVAPRTFGIDRWDDFDLVKPGAAETVPLYQLGAYGARDTYYSAYLADAHRYMMFLLHDDLNNIAHPEDAEDFENYRLGQIASWISIPLTSAISTVEQRGLVVDRDWVQQELEEHTKVEKDLTFNLKQMYPDLLTETGEVLPVSFAPTSRYFQAWTRAAVMDEKIRITSITKTGKPQWDHATLAKQARRGSDVAIDLLALRSHSMKSQFLRSWLGLMEQRPDRNAGKWMIHPQYNIGTVRTGRASSNSPNIQQVSPALRPAFAPREGYGFAELDFSQIELRVVAYVSQCAPMIEAFYRKDDLHTLLAASLNNKAMEDVTVAERQMAKQCHFALVYGMAASGFQNYLENNGIDVHIKEATRIRDGFFKKWVGLDRWHKNSVEEGYRSGQVVNLIGRVRRLPGLYSYDDKARMSAERQAVNSPIQSFASDLMQLSMASIAGRLPGIPPVEDAQIVLTIHDSIGVEIPLEPERGRLAILECRQRMESVAGLMQAKFGCQFDVPLIVDVKVGTRWGLNDLYDIYDFFLV